MIFSFSFSHLYFVYGFLFSCHDKRPPMIYYLIIEDLLNLYLHKTFIDSSTLGVFFCLFQIILFSYLSIYPHFSNILRRNLFCFIKTFSEISNAFFTRNVVFPAPAAAIIRLLIFYCPHYILRIFNFRSRFKNCYGTIRLMSVHIFVHLIIRIVVSSKYIIHCFSPIFFQYFRL